MPLGSRVSSVFRPVIRSEEEVFAYVRRVAVLCVVAAVAIDVANQLTFFVDWESSFRSWVISALVAGGIAAPVAYAIARAHLDLYRTKAAVEALSRTDPLTGLLNRRALFDPVDGTRAEVMALVIADIDRFKTVNDTHGHLAGDEVIKMVGQTMQAELGEFGRIGRIGGEEFALVSASSATETLIARLWDFRDRIASTPIVIGSVGVKVTISAGVASRRDGESFDNLFAEADRALYLAKAAGRNRVVSATDVVDAVAETEIDEPAPVSHSRKYRAAR